MRTCEDFEKLLPAYVAGVADPADVAEIGEHIAECESCTGDLQGTVQDIGLLKSWREPSLPEGLAAQVLERIVQVQETRRQIVVSEQATWGEPLERALALGAIACFGVIVVAILVTARAANRYEADRRACMDNLRSIGVSAAAEGVLRAPLDWHMEKMSKPPDLERKLCPLVPASEAGKPQHYRFNLKGPKYLAGDLRENHGWRDAHILLSDGSVIRVTPGQPDLWNLLDPSSPGR